MARSTLRYVLPLAGLLFLTPVHAGQNTTVGQFVKWSATEQVMYMAGALDVLTDTGWRCRAQQTVGDMVVMLQLAGSAQASMPLLTAIGHLLAHYECSLDNATATDSGPKVMS